MRKNDLEIQKKVSEWLSFADDDIRLARHALKLEGECPYRLIAYHAQQCVEKHLKAYLIFHYVDFPYVRTAECVREVVRKVLVL